MKTHLWERIEHSFHRRERPAAGSTGESSGASTGESASAGLHGRERIQTWLARLADTLPHFDRQDEDDRTKPH
ncbi:hypothetical protein [Lysobacter fragariae]